MNRSPPPSDDRRVAAEAAVEQVRRTLAIRTDARTASMAARHGD